MNVLVPYFPLVIEAVGRQKHTLSGIVTALIVAEDSLLAE